MNCVGGCANPVREREGEEVNMYLGIKYFV